RARSAAGFGPGAVGPEPLRPPPVNSAAAAPGGAPPGFSSPAVPRAEASEPATAPPAVLRFDIGTCISSGSEGGVHRVDELLRCALPQEDLAEVVQQRLGLVRRQGLIPGELEVR